MSMAMAGVVICSLTESLLVMFHLAGGALGTFFTDLLLHRHFFPGLCTLALCLDTVLGLTMGLSLGIDLIRAVGVCLALATAARNLANGSLDMLIENVLIIAEFGVKANLVKSGGNACSSVFEKNNGVFV